MVDMAVTVAANLTNASAVKKNYVTRNITEVEATLINTNIGYNILWAYLFLSICLVN